MQNTPSYSHDQHVISDRAALIRSTYIYLCVAIFTFIALSAVLMLTGVSYAALKMLPTSHYERNFLAILIIIPYMMVTSFATDLANTPCSNARQLIGLVIYVIANILFFIPLLALANIIGTEIIPAAVITTLLLLGGLSFTAFSSKKDFSFLRSFLVMSALAALGILITSIIFGFSLVVLFSGAMVLLCGGFILYDTPEIIQYYPADCPAGAALLLFASPARIFYPILIIFRSVLYRLIMDRIEEIKEREEILEREVRVQKVQREQIKEREIIELKELRELRERREQIKEREIREQRESKWR